MIALYLLCWFPAPNFKPGFMGTAEAKALGIKKPGNAPWGLTSRARPSNALNNRKMSCPIAPRLGPNLPNLTRAG